jgi:hypothetical protein
MLKRTLLLLIAAVAVVGVVACSDDDDATATPTPTATADDSGAAGTIPSAMGPGISVTEALASTLDGPLLVNGYLVITPEGARLCEVLAESFPPQCGGDSLTVDDPDPSALEQMTTEGDVSWTEDQIQLLGTVDGGTIHVQPLASS